MPKRSDTTPAAGAIEVIDSGDQVTVHIRPRPLGMIWLIAAFNVIVQVLLAVLAILYLVFHVQQITGLPQLPAHPRTPSAIHWYVGVWIGWIVLQTILFFGFRLIWSPLLTHETVTFAKTGLTASKRGPLRREQFASNWLNVAEIALLRDRQEIRPSRLVITLLSGAEYSVAENALESVRDRLEELFKGYADRFGQI